MRNVKKLFFTTIALTITSFLMKTVAVWFNVYLTGIVGSVGIGVFQLILTVYAMSKTLAYGGMNLAATRLCIDDFDHFRHSMKRLLVCAGTLGAFAMFLLFTFSDKISSLWIMTEKASLSLRVLSFSLPFVSLSAALNGYMTAARKMSRYSLIQFAEQIVKIAFTVVFVSRFEYESSDIIIALVCLSITISEVASFSLALMAYIFDVMKRKARSDGHPGFMKRMLRLAIPDAFGSYIRSALNTIEHLLIPRGIRSSGASTDKAFADYGVVQGMALPVLLYPSSILGVVSGLLVPEIAECKMKDNRVQVNYIINRVLQIAMLFSIITMGVMLGFSKELSLSIYKNTDAAYFIRLIAPLVPIMYLDMTTDGMLKGLDKQLDIMKINIIDSVLCVILVWILVPKMAVEGYIITIYAAEIINFLLSFYKLSKEANLTFQIIKNIIKPLFCISVSVLITKSIIFVFDPGIVLTISASIFVCLILLIISGAVSKEDTYWFKNLFRK